MIQQSYSWAYNWRKPEFERISAGQCLLQCYLQNQGHGSNPKGPVTERIKKM